MRILVVGGGGREHAIVKALERGGSEIYSAMRNHNPGIARSSKEIVLVRETDTQKVTEFAVRSKVELAVIGPEAPLEVGLVDLLESEGIRCVGPTKAAARIETSKSFAREVMSRHRVPGNLDFHSFDDAKEAKAFVKDMDMEVAVKPVGLTGGKGVKVQGEHLRTKTEVCQYIDEIFEKHIGGAGVVLEEKAIGEEFTLQSFCDGRDIAPMPLVQDHKRAFEGDEGPNTGGMGSYSDADHLLPFVHRDEHEKAVEIVRKMIGAMRSEGCPYKGVLYSQFMLTRDGPKVIEYNARFGDPEAMNVLTILSSDFPSICQGIAEGHLNRVRVDFLKKATVCKYVVPQGYGMESKAGLPISVDEAAIEREGARLYYAMVDDVNGKVLTTSSRAVGVVGVDDSLEKAEQACERALRFVKGEAIYVRHDIGKSNIVQRRKDHMDSLRT
ncbi:MAG TPA: phosphoribosylamine--glycine ligase [Methanomassiliicoccales archaeon]|jgi:phosphoribosylamine--glycine ligase